ncbi:Pep3/Vps18/deep orange family-domain-containing protein [Roridomyces roridus]|uniref:Pep3/Vps18/deep orange family-domain-containing protein n=1 Tax=Roridomyces roridus TaxID=1738132 RepID=A0AAD7BV77_9AGAR|nr:Pep3/Vps18/deep orange family-domain-containing protein [Roridomyces roridus]
MFDDYVEHAAAPPAVPLPDLQYEGFEPSPNEQENTLDPGLPEADPAAATAPIFDLCRVQYAFPAPLAAFVVCSDMLAMALATNIIVLIELSHADQIVKVQIPRKPSEMTVHKIFMDPSGRHIIVTSTQGENWYLYRSGKKPPRQLKSFKMVIESLAWNKAALLSSSHSKSTREILIGSQNGVVYEALIDAEEDFFKSPDRYLQTVLTTRERQPITGIKFDFFPPSDPRKVLVILTTDTRIYQYAGVPDRRSEDGGRVFSSLFTTQPQMNDFPGDKRQSELHYFSPNADQALSLPKSMAWLTSHGVYHGMLNFDSASENFIDSGDLLSYPSSFESSGPVTSMALTEFHFILLYADRVVGICNLDKKQTFEEALPLKHNEQVKGLAADPVRKTYWVYTDQSLFELVVDNEDRDVWKIYLHKGRFDVALRYAKTASQRDHVLSAQANSFFAEGRYFQAAQCYAQCSVAFEEVALKFLDAGERDSLRSYLISRLERTRKSDITQRMMLATWLVEFYLSKCNELDDIVASESVSHDVQNLQTERIILEGDLRQFFETYKGNLDPETVYELIQGHGRTDMYLHYATVIGDFQRVIEHWILEEEWKKAIDVIDRQSNLDLYYRFGPVLMRKAPKDTVDSWLKQDALDPLRLVPSLLQLQHAPRDPLSPNQAIRYLNHVVFELHNTLPTIHNLLITFYVSPSGASTEDDGPLLRFLSTAPADPLTEKPYYDLDYALRLCKQAGRTQPCVHIYSKMGLWENSVDLALEKGDLELAKLNADKPEDDQQLRKKLWLKIARYVVQDKKDIKTAMRFLENTDLLKIEDVLPFFPDFVVIDDFKEEITNALEGYSTQINGLKSKMDEATRTADSIKKDITALRNRFVTVDAGEQCSVCSHLLLTRQFYVFPCRHTFHADCLIGLAKEYLPQHALRRILALQNELVKAAPAPQINGSGPRQPVTQRTLLSANFVVNPLQTGTRAIGRNLLSAGDKLRDLIVPDALAAAVSAPAWMPGMGGGRRNGVEGEGRKAKTEKLRAELEDVLASSCPLCESVVAGLDKPFVKEGEVDTSWTL